MKLFGLTITKKQKTRIIEFHSNEFDDTLEFKGDGWKSFEMMEMNNEVVDFQIKHKSIFSTLSSEQRFQLLEVVFSEKYNCEFQFFSIKKK